jgi:hypothetical protein
MQPLTLELADRHGFPSLDNYQFVSKGILCLLPILYIYHYIQYLMDIVVNYCYKFYYISFSRSRDNLFAENDLLF